VQAGSSGRRWPVSSPGCRDFAAWTSSSSRTDAVCVGGEHHPRFHDAFAAAESRRQDRLSMSELCVRIVPDTLTQKKRSEMCGV